MQPELIVCASSVHETSALSLVVNDTVSAAISMFQLMPRSVTLCQSEECDDDTSWVRAESDDSNTTVALIRTTLQLADGLSNHSAENLEVWCACTNRASSEPQISRLAVFQHSFDT